MNGAQFSMRLPQATLDFGHTYSAQCQMTLAELFLRYLNRLKDGEAQNAVVNSMLNSFTGNPCGQTSLASARILDFRDYEDAVVAAAARKAKCAYIITSNTRDFKNPPIPALNPDEFLAL